jgi:radical SAM protein with 4Fe4S-binding SPASM domain
MTGQAPPVEADAPASMQTAERPMAGERLYREALGPPSGQAHFVLDPEAPAWAVLNEAGLRVLDLCDGHRSVDQIAGEIAAATGGDVQFLRPEVGAFLSQLAAARLLGAVPPEAQGELPAANRFRGVAIEITRACNLACRHCYLAAGDPGDHALTTVQLETAIREVKEAGGISVSIGGGEPLLHPDWQRIVECALAQDLLVVIGTNGTLIDGPIAGILASLPIKIQLSLDGATPQVHDAIRGEGSFAATLRAIGLLKAAGKGEDLVVAFTAMQPNIGELPAFIDLMEALEIRVVQFPPLAHAGRARRNWQDLALDDDGRLALWRTVHARSARLKGRMDLLADCFSLDIDRAGAPYRCNIGSQLRIDPDGNVYPCQCFHAGTKYRLGNVRTRSIAGIVGGSRLREVINDCLARPERIKRCSHCLWMNLCGAGCMGGAYENNGNPLLPEGCNVRRAWLRERFAERIGQPVAVEETA